MTDTRTDCRNNAPSAETVRDLPATVGLNVAAPYLGISLNLAYRLAKSGDLPFEVLRLGGSYRVTRAALAEALGIDLTAPRP